MLHWVACLIFANVLTIVSGRVLLGALVLAILALIAVRLLVNVADRRRKAPVPARIG